MPVVPCAPQPPVFGLVQFSAAEFLASYPEFTGINNANASALAGYFNNATLLLNNSCCSRVCDANTRLQLLYMLTAHVAAITVGSNDAGIGNPFFSGTASVTGATLTVVTVLTGALAVGSSLYDGPSVGGSLLTPGGAVITALGSGTGGIGTYTLNSTYGFPVTLEAMIVPGVPNIVQPLGVVGRISQASEGDVSVSSEWNAPANAGQAYFVQTKYGALYWTATARWRNMLIIPAPAGAYSPLAAYGLGPWAPGGPFGPGGGPYGPG